VIRARPLIDRVTETLGDVREITHHPDLDIHWFEGRGREPRIYQRPNGRGLPTKEWRELAISEENADWLRKAAGKRNKCPGPLPRLRAQIRDKILEDLKSGRRSVTALKSDTLSALAAAYGGSLNTAGAARTDAIADFQNSEDS
jgi:hypothetical protein